MATKADMKSRIALEFRRGDLTLDIANAIETAIDNYKYQRFAFNRAAFVDSPLNDSDDTSPWMNDAERLIRCRAKVELAVNVIRYDPTSQFVSNLIQEISDALSQLALSQGLSAIVATPGTLGYMKARIANEMNRGDLAPEIAAAIGTAIDAYKFERFPFNRVTFLDAPAADNTLNNAWMTTAERLIRSRAKLELYVNIVGLTPASDTVTTLVQEVTDALSQTRLSQTQAAIAATPGTLGFMKTRIANELNRGDLSTEIGNAIADAIEAYNDERFYFNETRAHPFLTIAGQSDYDVDDDAEYANVLKIDYIDCLAGGTIYKVFACDPETIEQDLGNAGPLAGIPSDYAYYGETLRLYPIPADVYTLRIGYVQKVGTPADDAAAGNPWMTKAEKLIRCRAKAELYVHVAGLAQGNEAATFMEAAEEELSSLQALTNRKTRTGSSGTIRAYD